MIMKRTILFSLVLSACTLMAFQGYQNDPIKDYCNASEAKKASKETLAPYTYDAAKTNKFTFKNKVQKREIEVPLFIGEKYRFVFNTSGLPQPVKIEVYDKSSDSKKRSLLFTSDDAKANDNQIVWEPEKSKKCFVNYTVPVTNDTLKKGCVTMVVGYKSKFKKDDSEQ